MPDQDINTCKHADCYALGCQKKCGERELEPKEEEVDLLDAFGYAMGLMVGDE